MNGSLPAARLGKHRVGRHVDRGQPRLAAAPVALWACALPAEAKTLEATDVHLVGPGVRDVTALEQALATSDYDVLVGWGVAGALRPELSVGDLVVPRWVVDERGRRWDCRPELLGLAATGARTLVTTAEPVLTPQQRIELREGTGAEAVDMESARLAALCAKFDVPFVCVRAISDAAHTTLPRWVGEVIDESGHVRAAHLLASLLREPASLARLYGMARGMSGALKTLRRLAESQGPEQDWAA